jgi:hypothetical protein
MEEMFDRRINWVRHEAYYAATLVIFKRGKSLTSVQIFGWCFFAAVLAEEEFSRTRQRAVAREDAACRP